MTYDGPLTNVSIGMYNARIRLLGDLTLRYTWPGQCR